MFEETAVKRRRSEGQPEPELVLPSEPAGRGDLALDDLVDPDGVVVEGVEHLEVEWVEPVE